MSLTGLSATIKIILKGVIFKAMAKIRNSTLIASSDLLKQNQISNVAYPVRPKISAEICRGAEV
jgi:hypothetical protein